MFYFFYYIPVGLDVRLRRFPILTWTFAAACLAVFLLNRYTASMLPSASGGTIDFYEMIYVPGDNAIVAVAAAFLHFGWIHLLGNLLYLGFFGQFVEDRLGRRLYAFLYLSAAGIGNYLQGVFNSNVLDDPYMGIIGASGAVSGLLGVFAVRFIHNKVKIAYWVFMPLQALTRAGRVEMPAIFAVVLWVLMQAARGLVQLEGAAANVAYVTHIGGFVWGMVVAIAAGQFGKGTVEAQLAKAERYMKKGEPYAAQGAYIRYLTHRPESADAHAGLARAMVTTNDRAAARKNYARACELMLAQGRRGDAERLFREALRGFPNFTLNEQRGLNLALGLERNVKQDLAITAYLNFADRYPLHPEAAFAIVRAAGIYKAADPGKASELYSRVLEAYPENEWIDFVREEHRALAGQAA